MTCWHRSTTGSPRGSTRPISRKPRHCWRRWCNTTQTDTSFHHARCVGSNQLKMKRFHEALAGNAYECLLKSSIGKTSFLLGCSLRIESHRGEKLLYLPSLKFLAGSQGISQHPSIASTHPLGN